jgi:hypothetical protein
LSALQSCSFEMTVRFLAAFLRVAWRLAWDDGDYTKPYPTQP